MYSFLQLLNFFIIFCDMFRLINKSTVNEYQNYEKNIFTMFVCVYISTYIQLYLRVTLQPDTPHMVRITRP